MSKWLATVTSRIDGKIWSGIFDFEISEEQVKMKSSLQGYVQVQEIDYYQTSTLPEVSSDVLFALEKDILEKNWFENTFTLLSLNQPILYEYLKMNGEKHGEITALIGLIVYHLIESQIEANNVEKT